MRIIRMAEPADAGSVRDIYGAVARTAISLSLDALRPADGYAPRRSEEALGAGPSPAPAGSAR